MNSEELFNNCARWEKNGRKAGNGDRPKSERRKGKLVSLSMH